MEHIVRNDGLKEKLGIGETRPDLKIYSCQFDNGEMTNGNFQIIRLGADGLEVWIIPCFSCWQQIFSCVVEELVDKKIDVRVKKHLSLVFRED